MLIAGDKNWISESLHLCAHLVNFLLVHNLHECIWFWLGVVS